MNRRSFIRQTCRGIGAMSLARSPIAGASAQRPNIVKIYADDIGYGDLSCYGAKGIRTPNLDRLAGDGLQFTNAHSSSATCTPSRYSLLTGEYAWRREGTSILAGDAPLVIKPGTPTIASVLKSRGYATAVIGKWHLGLGSGNPDWNGEIKPGPLDIGFDYAFLIPATGDRVPCVFVENRRVVNLDPKDPIRVNYQSPFSGEPTGRDHPELLKMKPSHGHDQAIVNGVSRIGYMTGGKSALWTDENMADTLVSKAAAFIDRQGTNPFFLYFATHDIHVPRVPHPRFAGQSGMGPRGDAILELDWSVGEILKTLDKRGLAKNTLVLFSSDNGPVVDDGYRDEAVEKLGNHKPAGQFRGGKYSKYEGGTRVPLIARWPGHIAPDSRTDALVSQVDLLASFAALTGAKTPASARDSLNVVSALLGKSQSARQRLIEHGEGLALIDGSWKLVVPAKGPIRNENTNIELGNSLDPQLFNVADDPSERTNVAARFPEKVQAMSDTLEAIRNGAPPR